jgi:predicted  nucleic acid-binding Zn-ribbon protein
LREQIELLTSLQNVDREIRGSTHAKEALLAEIRQKVEALEAKKTEVEQVRGEWMEKDKLRQEKERTLQEGAGKAMEKRMRMSRIKNLKELQSLQREIDLIKQGNTQLEEELIVVMEELESREGSLREKEEELKKVEEEWAQKRGEIEAKLGAIEDGVAEASKARKALADQLNGELIQRYELIFSRRAGMAVVAVSDGICQGCYMNIPPQLSNEIRRNEKLNLCPSCHRILYYKPTIPSDKQV